MLSIEIVYIYSSETNVVSCTQMLTSPSSLLVWSVDSRMLQFHPLLLNCSAIPCLHAVLDVVRHVLIIFSVLWVGTVAMLVVLRNELFHVGVGSDPFDHSGVAPQSLHSLVASHGDVLEIA